MLCDHVLDFSCVSMQAEAYSAMIEPVADALCYLTPMGFDVLGFVIIDRLTTTSRAKIKVGVLCSLHTGHYGAVSVAGRPCFCCAVHC
jgi:hypothetical protein